MSFIINWDVDKIINDLRSAHAQAASSYNDGFSAWGCKRDLLKVKYALDAMLDQTPSFSHVEAQFHEQMAKEQTWKILKTEDIK
jgi:hypothetical protein